MTLAKRLLVELFILVTLILNTASCGLLDQFGYGTLSAGRNPVMGTRPVLVVLVEDPTVPQHLAHDAAFYWDRVFNASYSTKNFFTAASNGVFTISAAGVLGPFVEDSETRRTGGPFHLMKFAILAAAQAGFDFAHYDVNHDGIVSDDELGIMQIDNVTEFGGATRSMDCVRPPGSLVQVCTHVAASGSKSNFATWNHEFSHTLGAFDMYGSQCLGAGVNLMSCTAIASPDLLDTVYHDPWHRMRWGWVRPRLVEMGAEGCYIMKSVEWGAPDSMPVLLFSASKGFTDYFLFEARERATEANLFDRSLRSTGVSVWSVHTNRNFEPEQIPPIGNAAATDPSIFPVGGGNGLRSNSAPWIDTDGEFTLKWQDNHDVGVKIKVGPLVGGVRKLQIVKSTSYYAEGHGPCGSMSFAGQFGSQTVRTFLEYPFNPEYYPAEQGL